MEENKNTITYAENWNKISESEYPEIIPIDEEFKENKSCNNKNIQKNIKELNNSSKQLLITLQLIICLLVALAAFVVKGIGGNMYTTIRELYYSNLNNSAIFDTYLSTPDLSSIFIFSTNDEAKSR